MIPRQFASLRPGEQISADEYNRLSAAVEQASRTTGEGVLYGPAGLALREQVDEIDIRFLGPPDDMGRYSFEEVVKFYDPATGHQEWIKRDGGYEGNPLNFPAYEINDNRGIGYGVVTRAWRGFGDHLLFEHCCAGGGSGSSGFSAGFGSAEDPFPIKHQDSGGRGSFGEPVHIPVGV